MESYYYAQTSMITSGSMLVNAIGQGDNVQQREGKVVQMKSLDIRVMASPISATTGSSYGFWAVVLDRQPNGAAPNFGSDVWDLTAVTDAALAPRSPNYIERFAILCRRDFAFGTVASDMESTQWHEVIGFNEEDGHVRFNTTTAAIAAISTNSLYFYWAISGQAGFAPASNYSVISAGAQLRFIDP